MRCKCTIMNKIQIKKADNIKNWRSYEKELSAILLGDDMTIFSKNLEGFNRVKHKVALSPCNLMPKWLQRKNTIYAGLEEMVHCLRIQVQESQFEFQVPRRKSRQKHTCHIIPVSNRQRRQRTQRQGNARISLDSFRFRERQYFKGIDTLPNDIKSLNILF